jgi:hypothetical protein
MTGGRAVILGSTGRNFAAGMSGGVAYVWDPQQDFAMKCNAGTVDLEAIEEDEDIVELREMIELHQEYTGSPVAARILDQWPMSVQQFVKVMPTDYKRVLAERKRHDEEVEQKQSNDDTGSFVAQARYIQRTGRAWASPPALWSIPRRASRIGMLASACAIFARSSASRPKTTSAIKALAAWTAACPSASPTTAAQSTT